MPDASFFFLAHSGSFVVCRVTFGVRLRVRAEPHAEPVRLKLKPFAKPLAPLCWIFDKSSFMLHPEGKPEERGGDTRKSKRTPETRETTNQKNSYSLLLAWRLL